MGALQHRCSLTFIVHITPCREADEDILKTVSRVSMLTGELMLAMPTVLLSSDRYSFELVVDRKIGFGHLRQSSCVLSLPVSKISSSPQERARDFIWSI